MKQQQQHHRQLQWRKKHLSLPHTKAAASGLAWKSVSPKPGWALRSCVYVSFSEKSDWWNGEADSVPVKSSLTFSCCTLFSVIFLLECIEILFLHLCVCVCVCVYRCVWCVHVHVYTIKLHCSQQLYFDFRELFILAGRGWRGDWERGSRGEGPPAHLAETAARN